MPKEKVGFQVGSVCRTTSRFITLCHGATGVEKRRLADAGAGSDDEHSPTPGENPYRCQFGFALKELDHISNGRRLDA
jgi:hypothetical protein